MTKGHDKGQMSDREAMKLELDALHRGDVNAKRQAFNREWNKYMGELVQPKSGE